MITFTLAQEVLKDGGYLIVDEIENHFNKEIVSTLIRFFMDGKINEKWWYANLFHSLSGTFG